MSTWYLGGPGDLRPLVCPDGSVSMNTVRYGGVHQGLSGARRTDITGFRNEYSFTFEYLDQDEYHFLELMYNRIIRGPHRLINPLKKNRLSTAAAQMAMSRVSATGVHWPYSYSTGESATVSTALGFNAFRRNVFSWATSGLSYLRFDSRHRTTVFPNETITGSIYVSSSGTPGAAQIGFDYYDRFGTLLSSSGQSFSHSNVGYTRATVTRTVPAGTATVVMWVSVSAYASGQNFFFACPQVESGSAATTWEPGGAAPVVSIDQITTDTPRFPLRNCSMTLVEY